MAMRITLFVLNVVVFFSAWQSVANASEIYRWVSDDGVVHFSDTRPANRTSVTTLTLRETNAKNYDPSTDPYSILNQAKRISQSWMELQMARREREKEQLEEADNGRPYQQSATYSYTYYPPITYFSSVPVRKALRHQPRAARRQLNALEEVGLVGQRPHSINSSAHRARVLRSRSLPVVTPKQFPRQSLVP